MSGLVFYTIDLETNGIKCMYHTVNEISIIRHTDRVQLSKKIRCKSPEKSSYDALKITGKTLQDLMHGEENSDVVDKCNKFLEEDGLSPAHRVIVGHNIFSFDRRFLHAMWEEEGKIFPANSYCDTMTMCKTYVKQRGLAKQRVNLAAASQLMGINKFANAHSAKGDSRQTYLLFNKLIESGMDYFPFIKTYPHTPAGVREEFEPDMSIFEDLEDDISDDD